jgi:hypothetical protein
MGESSDGGPRPQNEDRTRAGDNTLAYAAPGPRVSVLGVMSMCLGVGSIALSLTGGLGAMLATAALPAGIVARVLIGRNPQRLAGVGYANLGIATAVLGVVLFALFVPCMCYPREMSNRSVCAANLRGLMQSLVIYSADNGDHYPMMSPAGYGLATAPRGAPSVTRNFWYLVQIGAVAPKQFLCKSDSAPTVAASDTFENFNDGKVLSDLSYSYSFGYPWTAAPRTRPDGKVIPAGSIVEWWTNSMDAGIPLIADMAPLAGTGSPPARPGDGRTNWANSFNHQRDGQNVVFGDAHAEFARRVNVGDKNDNIYAGSKGVPNEIGLQTAGTVPDIGTGGGPGGWDVCLVPAADGVTGVRK